MKVAVFSAFPHEISGVIRLLGMKRTLAKNPFLIYAARCKNHDIVVVRTGIGIGNLSSAFNFVLQGFHPGCIISAGFGGALYPGASAGDLILASRIFMLPEHRPHGEVPGFDSWEECFFHNSDAERIQIKISEKIHIKSGAIITLRNWTAKAGIRKVLPAGFLTAVCDMETYFLAKLAEGKGLPFFGIRSVSDCADVDVPQELLEVSDEAGFYNFLRALRIIFSRPRLLPSVIRLGKNSRIASKNLGCFIDSIMEVL